MRHVLLAAGAALILAVGFVLVLAGGEEDVVVDDNTADTSIRTAPGATAPGTQAKPAPAKSRDVQRVEEVVALYVEAAERGDVPAEGLPTTDELSIDRVVASGDGRAVAHLVGGARVYLSRQGGRWRVERVQPAPVPVPSPPSNG
jgi:hypothetical protein